MKRNNQIGDYSRDELASFGTPGTHLGGPSFKSTRCGGEVGRKMHENDRFLKFCEENYLMNIGWNLARGGDLEASR
jgi:hypothetical protein